MPNKNDDRIDLVAEMNKSLFSANERAKMAQEGLAATMARADALRAKLNAECRPGVDPGIDALNRLADSLLGPKSDKPAMTRATDC